MTYFYCTKTHIRYFIIKLLLDIICSPLIMAALCLLVLWIIHLPIFLMLDHSMILIILLLPFSYLANDIRSFLQQWAYENDSELRIQPEQDVPVEIVIQKKVYRELYHVSLVTDVKKTRKGIAVYGRIAAEYIYDPEIGRHDTDAPDHILIPPYFSDQKGIVRELARLIRIDTQV